MTSRYSARIRVDAGDRAPAILAAVGADAGFHSESGQEAVRVSAGAGGGEGHGGAAPGGARAVAVDIGADQLPHLRAGVSSTLRLVQAAYESIGAAAEPGAEAAAAPAAGGARGGGGGGGSGRARRAGRAAQGARGGAGRRGAARR